MKCKLFEISPDAQVIVHRQQNTLGEINDEESEVVIGAYLTDTTFTRVYHEEVLGFPKASSADRFVADYTEKSARIFLREVADEYGVGYLDTEGE